MKLETYLNLFIVNFIQSVNEFTGKELDSTYFIKNILPQLNIGSEMDSVIHTNSEIDAKRHAFVYLNIHSDQGIQNYLEKIVKAVYDSELYQQKVREVLQRT